MKILLFGRDVAAETSVDSSVGLALSRVARIDGRSQISVVHLSAHGRIGSRRNPVNQLFMVVAGQGWVEGSEGVAHAIQPGRAAFWGADEEHSVATESGLIAVVIESSALDPISVMPAAD